MTRNRIWIVTIAVIELLGIGSAALSGSGFSAPWFAALAKPWFMPPGWVFPVVWTILYALMGIALADLIRARPPGPRRAGAIALFVLQLALNLSWSPVFFGLHKIDLGLGIILMLDLVVVATILASARVRTRAAVLLLPYAAWLALATALNWSILRMNG